MASDGGRLAPLTGVGFLVLMGVGFALGGDAPDPKDDSAREIVKFYADQGSGAVVGLVLAGLGSVLFVFFGSHLRRVLSAAEDDGGMLPTVAFAGTIIVTSGIAFDSSLNLTLQESAKDISPAAVQSLAALYSYDFIPMLVGMLLFLLGTGLSVVRTAALPKWIGWVALLLAVTAVTPVGFVAFIGGGILTAAMGIVMAVSAARAPETLAA